MTDENFDVPRPRPDAVFDATMRRHSKAQSEAFMEGAHAMRDAWIVGAPNPKPLYAPDSQQYQDFVAGMEEADAVILGEPGHAPKGPVRVASVNPVDIANQAGEFYTLATQGLKPPRTGILSGPFIAYTTCMAFSVELGLKALYCLENPEGHLPKGHSLRDLFGKLSVDLQTALIEECRMAPDAFRTSLKRDSRTFERWRYAYESYSGQTSGVTLMTHPAMLKHLSKACNKHFGRLEAR